MKSKHILVKISAVFTILVCALVCACKAEVVPDTFYKVYYETEHGTAPETKEVRSGTVLKDEDLPALTAEGYTFEGWYKDSTLITADSKFAVREDTTLKAKWTQIIPEDPPEEEVYYTVSYETEFEDAPPSRKFLAGDPILIGDLYVLAHDGYYFDGWYYNGQKIQSQYKVTCDMVLVAKWIPYYTVSYESEHGTVPHAKEVLADTVLTAEDLPTLEEGDYTFEGWYIGNTLITAASNYKVTANVKLTGVWKKDKTNKNLNPFVGLTIHDASNESNFTLTAQKSGSDYIITATEGYDLYAWAVDNIDDSDNYFYSDEIIDAFTTGNFAPVLKQNTLTFNEDNLPPAVVADGTYRIYCQAIKILYDFNGNPLSFSRAGLCFVVIKM